MIPYSSAAQSTLPATTNSVSSSGGGGGFFPGYSNANTPVASQIPVSPVATPPDNSTVLMLGAAALGLYLLMGR
jgi:hypothetical protein